MCLGVECKDSKNWNFLAHVLITGQPAGGASVDYAAAWAKNLRTWWNVQNVWAGALCYYAQDICTSTSQFYLLFKVYPIFCNVDVNWIKCTLFSHVWERRHMCGCWMCPVVLLQLCCWISGTSVWTGGGHTSYIGTFPLVQHIYFIPIVKFSSLLLIVSYNTV